MAWTVLLLWLTVWPLCWISITIGSRQENISSLRILGYSVCVSLGVTGVLLATIALAAKMFSSIIAAELDPILRLLLLLVTPEHGCGPTVTFIGTVL